MQVLQAANTGITSLSSLVDTAKSIANQVLQQPSGYSTKATYTTAVPTGAGPLAIPGTATDLTNGATNSLGGQAIKFDTAAGTTTITLGTAANQVNSISALNTALAAANIQLQASFNTNGSLTFASTNDAASQVITNGAAYVAPPATASTSVNIDSTSGAAFVGGTIVATRPQPGVSGHPRVAGQPVQPDPFADHHHGAGSVLQRHQPAERRLAEDGVRRNRQVDLDDRRRDLQSDRSRPEDRSPPAPTSSTTLRPTTC